MTQIFKIGMISIRQYKSLTKGQPIKRIFAKKVQSCHLHLRQTICYWDGWIYLIYSGSEFSRSWSSARSEIFYESESNRILDWGRFFFGMQNSGRHRGRQGLYSIFWKSVFEPFRMRCCRKVLRCERDRVDIGSVRRYIFLIFFCRLVTWMVYDNLILSIILK